MKKIGIISFDKLSLELYFFLKYIFFLIFFSRMSEQVNIGGGG